MKSLNNCDRVLHTKKVEQLQACSCKHVQTTKVQGRKTYEEYIYTQTAKRKMEGGQVLNNWGNRSVYTIVAVHFA